MAEPVSAENQQLLDFFNTYGVKPEVQEELLLKLQNGEMWDSLGGAAPISEKQLPSGEILSTYPDGSIAVFSYFDGQQVTLPFASLGRLVSPQPVSDCAFSGSYNGNVSNTRVIRYSDTHVT